MIPGWLPALAVFAVACGFFTGLGLPLARAVMPRGMPALGVAPALGWAAYTVLALPLLTLVGFGPAQINAFSILAVLAAAIFWPRGTRPDRPVLPPWCLGLAGLTAWLPAMAIMPKHAASGILLAPPMFDHVKIAVVDAILRNGLPVPNPFYGPDNPGQLAYYYLWHVGTALLAAALHTGGWTAEAAMTGFTAFASLMLMLSLAAAFGARIIGLGAVILLSLPGSLRPLLAALLGADGADRLIPRGAELGFWLNQAAWVPQHLASACCAVMSALLMLRLAESGSVLVAVCLGLTIAAGFESSIWVGGIGFAFAGLGLGLTLLRNIPAPDRRMFITRAGAACGLAAVLILPLFLAELKSAQSHGPGAGLAFVPYRVFGKALPAFWRDLLNLPGFWFLLPFAWPAIVPLGIAGAWSRVAAGHRLMQRLSVFGTPFLGVAWLLRSTIDNNDLGWRAVLPAMLLLIPLAASCLDELARKKQRLKLAICVAIAALGLPDSARMIGEYADGQRPGDAPGFAQAGALWQAVRHYAGPQDRVANNPLFISAATPWPVNISWATLADRPSCFAGWATMLAYAPMPRDALVRINDRFKRVFDGPTLPGDIAALARQDNCAVAVVTDGDGAWHHDPFAGTPLYRLAEAKPGWKIYKRTSLVPTLPVAPAHEE